MKQVLDQDPWRAYTTKVWAFNS